VPWRPPELSVRPMLPGLVIIAGLVALLTWGLSSLAPDAVVAKRDPGFIDTIFANEVVVAAARVVLLATAGVLLATGVYIVISMGIRISHGEWLRRAGPFEVELAEKRLDEVEDHFDDLVKALDENAELEERLEERDELVGQLLADLERLLGEVKRLGRGGRS
jgi:hypothetical protein